MNVSMVQEIVLTEKATGKKHPAYALVQGYNLYYAVPGYRGMEQIILIPTDCGFEEAIKDDLDFVYYKNA